MGPNRVVERPHAVYNELTATYVMYMHIDNSDYSERKCGVATCDTVCGDYTYLGSFKPLGHDSLDDTVFVDTDGKGYFISEDRTNAKLQVYLLSDDYLNVSSLVNTLSQYEAPAMVLIDGTYFLFGSHLSGWSTNDNQYTTSNSITGTWGSWKSFAPYGSCTCNSQTTFVLPVQGSQETSYVFMADRWVSTDLVTSTYVWEPLDIQSVSASIYCYETWCINALTGEVSTPSFYNLAVKLTGYLADVDGASTSDSANVIQWGADGGENQMWEFKDTSVAGYVSIVNVNSGKCLDVKDASTASGATIIQYTCHNGTNQQWNLVSIGTGYYQLTVSHSGMCLHVQGDSYTEGTQLEQYACDVSDSGQLWSLSIL